MLKNTINCLFINKNTLRKCMTTAAAPKEKWDLMAGVLVERLPRLTKTLQPLQEEFQAMLTEIEFENSLKSDHEIQKERDIRQMERLKRGEIEPDLDASKQTAQDMEDQYTDELAKFKPAPRITEADKKNDTRSTDRKLEETLFLLVEQKLGDKSHMLLPQGKRTEGETMRQTAERVLREQCGANLDVFFYGNAPCGFYKYKYPSGQRTDVVGAKVFFFRTALRKADIDGKAVKYQWLDKAELEQQVKVSYFQSISKFLL